MKTSKKTLLKLVNSILIIITSYFLLHIALILNLIPYAFFWGGKINSLSQLYLFESLALVILVFIGVTTIIRRKQLINTAKATPLIKRMMLVFSIFFILNSIGNLLAETMLEKCQTVITLYLAMAFYRLNKSI